MGVAAVVTAGVAAGVTAGVAAGVTAGVAAGVVGSWKSSPRTAARAVPSACCSTVVAAVVPTSSAWLPVLRAPGQVMWL